MCLSSFFTSLVRCICSTIAPYLKLVSHSWGGSRNFEKVGERGALHQCLLLEILSPTMVARRRKTLIFKQLKWLKWRTFACGLNIFVFPGRRKKNTILIFVRYFTKQQILKKIKKTRKKLICLILTKDFVTKFSLVTFWRISL